MSYTEMNFGGGGGASSAQNVTFTPTDNIESTNVQSAIEEVFEKSSDSKGWKSLATTVGRQTVDVTNLDFNEIYVVAKFVLGTIPFNYSMTLLKDSLDNGRYYTGYGYGSQANLMYVDCTNGVLTGWECLAGGNDYTNTATYYWYYR